MFFWGQVGVDLGLMVVFGMGYSGPVEVLVV